MTKYVAGKCKLNNLINITYDDLSNMTGISKLQLSEYVNNKRKMSLDNAITIAKTLSVSVEDLYEWEVKD